MFSAYRLPGSLSLVKADLGQRHSQFLRQSTRVTLMRPRVARLPASHGSLIDSHSASNCNHGECGRHDLRPLQASGSDLGAPRTFHDSRVAGRSEYGTTGLTRGQANCKFTIRVFRIQDYRVIRPKFNRGAAGTVGIQSGRPLTARGTSPAPARPARVLSGVTR